MTSRRRCAITSHVERHRESPFWWRHRRAEEVESWESIEWIKHVIHVRSDSHMVGGGGVSGASNLIASSWENQVDALGCCMVSGVMVWGVQQRGGGSGWWALTWGAQIHTRLGLLEVCSSMQNLPRTQLSGGELPGSRVPRCERLEMVKQLDGFIPQLAERDRPPAWSPAEKELLDEPYRVWRMHWPHQLCSMNDPNRECLSRHVITRVRSSAPLNNETKSRGQPIRDTHQ